VIPGETLDVAQIQEAQPESQWILQDRAHHERGFRWYEGTEGNIGKIKTFRK
jgi:hypothetical protein